MKKNLILILTVFSICTLLMLTSSFIGNKQPNIAYVINSQLFEQFNAKAEMQAKLQHLAATQRTKLDSIKLQLSVLQNTSDNEQTIQFAAQLKQQYEYMQYSFEKEENQRNLEYTKQAWEHINQYVYEYGQQHGYDYIFGTQGGGNLMFGSPEENITKSVLQFINERHEGI